MDGPNHTDIVLWNLLGALPIILVHIAGLILAFAYFTGGIPGQR